MRKNTFFIIMLLVGVVAFVAAPAFAEYNESDVMMDQADNSLFGMGSMLTGPDGPGNSVGQAADDNPNYGPGTFRVPYATQYGFPGCDNGTLGGPNTLALGPDGNPISATYNCEGTGDTGMEANLIIQDLFTKVSEGTIGTPKPAGGDFGIAQYLDSLFAYNGVDGNVDPLQNVAENAAAPQSGNVYINQTLDQDLADITAASNQFGIWQRFHQAFTHTENAELGPNSHYDHDGIDQTLIAFLSEESGPDTAAAAPGEIMVYMAQWFQIGGNQSCTEAETNLGVNLCDHTEFGGHGTVNGGGVAFNPASTEAAHDP
jgi:hypothetical protein